MDFNELVARAPWAGKQTPSTYYPQVFRAFRLGLRSGRMRLQVAPFPGKGRSLLPSHPWPELFLILTGINTFDTPGGLMAGDAGSMVLIPRGTPHGERWQDVGSGHSLVVAMPRDGRLVVQTAILEKDGRRHPRHHQVFPDHEGADSARLCDELSTVTRSAADADIRQALAEALLGRLERCAASTDRPVTNRIVERCLHLLADRLHHPSLTVAALARALGTSPDYLGRAFSETTGETLLAHISRRRISVACDMLAEGGHGVAEVASLCGFTDPAYFSRVFRSRLGLDPRTYRRRSIASEAEGERSIIGTIPPAAGSRQVRAKPAPSHPAADQS